MPQYCYRCPACGQDKTELRTMADRNDLPKCGCGETMLRDVVSEHTATPLEEFRKPIEMWSIAPNTPEERRDLEKAGATFNEDGVPLARNRQEKLKFLDTVGFVELS